MAGEQYLVLARKWRPQTFEDVVGQEHITRTLQNAIASGRVGHAFLFIGSRGIGKTTTARILARALNCQAAEGPTASPCGACDNCRSIAAGNNIDVIEIDGASNNGVDDVRQIRENIRLVPSRSRFKVYVIDEVHMLSTSAFNALLKTLEEPPEHAVFILATTEAAKIPATIISRCQRYDFRRIKLADIVALLRRIVEAEGVACRDEALYAIARAADGGARDAQSILEQVISYCGKEIAFQDVFDVLGLVDWQALHGLCDAMLAKDTGALLTLVDDVTANGKDLAQFVQNVLQYFRNLLVCKTADAKKLLSLPDEELVALQARAEKFSLMELIRLVEQFAELSKDFDSQLAQRIALEAALVRMSRVAAEVSLDTVLEKLMLLGAGGVGQGIAASSPGPPSAPMRSVPASAPGKADCPREGMPPAEGNLARKTVIPESAPVPRQIELTENNLRQEWQAIARRVGGEKMNLGIWLGQAAPVGIEGDVVVLQYAAHQTLARAHVEKAENRAILERILSEIASNVRTYRVAMAREVSPAPDSGEGTAVSGPMAPRVTPEDVRAAMSDVRVAKVVDVFKGVIVDVKRSGSPES